MGEEVGVNDVFQNIEKKIRPKSKKNKKNGGSHLIETKIVCRDEVVEHPQKTHIEDGSVMKRHCMSKKEKEKDEKTKYSGDGCADVVNVTEKNCEKLENEKEKNANKSVEAGESPISNKVDKKKRKKLKATKNNEEGGVESEKLGDPRYDYSETDTMNKFGIKKKKRGRRVAEECKELLDNTSQAKKSKIYDDLAANKLAENEINNKNVYGMTSEGINGESFQMVTKTKKSRSASKKNDADISSVKQDVVLEYDEGNVCSNMHDEDTVKKHERKKKKKHTKIINSIGSSPGSQPIDICREDVDNSDSNKPFEMKGMHCEVEKINKKKKKKTKSVDKDLNNSVPPKNSKKVTFSGQVDIFPVTDDLCSEKGNDGPKLVMGKRFTRDEDRIVKEAVYSYIEDHYLGEDGLNMVLNCKKFPQLRGCWREIATAIPYRPYRTIYLRAQVLFRRGESRRWTQEECDMVLKFQEEHGNDWKALADELGKHRWHVKDTWRRIKLPNAKKGAWSQDEYQTLFDLVNADLQLRVDEDKKSKHGMLRDNICWTAISDKMATRPQALCCIKWYQKLTSPMVAQGLWADTDDYRLLRTLYGIDAGCIEDVDWDNVLEHRSGAICRLRWSQMVQHIGYHGKKPFPEQVDELTHRYCPDLVKFREIWDNKPRVP